MYHKSIHSRVYGYLGCFYVLAIINSAGYVYYHHFHNCFGLFKDFFFLSSFLSSIVIWWLSCVMCLYFFLFYAYCRLLLCGYHNVFFLFSDLFIFNWRIIALKYHVGFYHTSTSISHRYTNIPSLLNLPPNIHLIPSL